jgi:hypothetical protein
MPPQDIDEDMGPTVFLPRSHTRGAHNAYNLGQPKHRGVECVVSGRDEDGDWEAIANAAVKDTSEWASFLRSSCSCSPLLGRGDCVIFDSRLMHFADVNCSDACSDGDGNNSGTKGEGQCSPQHQQHNPAALRPPRGRRRVLFYFSLRARGMGAHWKGCGFDKPGTMLNELRGRYHLSGEVTLWGRYNRGNGWTLLEGNPSGDLAVCPPGMETTWQWIKNLMFGVQQFEGQH